MPEFSYPYTGGQGVTDAVYEQLMAEVTGNGRINLRGAGQSLTVPIMYADSSGRQVKFRANSSYLIRGFRWDSQEGHTRTLDSNTSGNPRLDLGVLRLNRSNYTVRLAIVKGVPAATPTVPAVTQNLGSTGVFEIPLGYARVNHNSSNIISSDVTSLETWHTLPGQLGHSTQRPTTVEPGMQWVEYDTGRIYVGLPSGWHLIGERTSQIKLEASAGWDPDRDFIYVQRVNGWTSFQAIVYRPPSGTNAALPAGTDARMTTLSDYYKPISSFYATGSAPGTAGVRVYFDAVSGHVVLLDHPNLPAGTFVHIGPITYPSKV